MVLGRIPSVSRRRAAADSLSDDALLAGVALGDDDMAVAFVRRFQRRVYGLALSMVGDGAAAEDIAQEAFLRAWRHAPVFDPRRGSVVAWLLSITRNLAIDNLRLRRATPLDPETFFGFPNIANTPDPTEAALDADLGVRLRRALATLPPDQRRAILLAALHGRTAQEIGEAEGIPLGTAKTRIRAGMGKLRAALAREGTLP